ncbi:hypothetical protein QD47_23470, partial [Paenibacillus terrae]
TRRLDADGGCRRNRYLSSPGFEIREVGYTANAKACEVLVLREEKLGRHTDKNDPVWIVFAFKGHFLGSLAHIVK